MTVAVAASVLLFASTFLPHVVTPFPHSYSLWDVLNFEDRSRVNIATQIALAIAVNALYFIRRVRRSWLRSPRALRLWALLALIVNVVVVIEVIDLSAGFDSETVDLTRGLGFYLMIISAVCMVVGSLVGVLAPQRAADIAQIETVPPAPPPPKQSPDAAARLRQLKSLLDDGLLTQEEYDTRRQRILDDI